MCCACCELKWPWVSEEGGHPAYARCCLDSKVELVGNAPHIVIFMPLRLYAGAVCQPTCCPRLCWGMH